MKTEETPENSETKWRQTETPSPYEEPWTRRCEICWCAWATRPPRRISSGRLPLQRQHRGRTQAVEKRWGAIRTIIICDGAIATEVRELIRGVEIVHARGDNITIEVSVQTTKATLLETLERHIAAQGALQPPVARGAYHGRGCEMLWNSHF